MVEGVQASLGLEARASQDAYGSSPQSFPYVSFFPEVFASGGQDSYTPSRRHRLMNLGVEPSGYNESVRVTSGTVYCGFTPVDVGSGSDSAGSFMVFPNESSVWLNISVDRSGAFKAGCSGTASGDMSVKLYDIRDRQIDDYLSGTLFIPYYN